MIDNRHSYRYHGGMKGFSVQPKGDRWFVVFSFKGRQVWRTTHMSDKGAAERLAPGIRESYIAEHYRRMVNPEPEPAPAPNWATIGQIVDAYRATNKRCNGDTESRAIARFHGIIRAISGCARGKEGAQPSTLLTRANAERWQAMRQGLATPDLSTRRRENITINSTWRQARDLFAARYRASAPWAALQLPPDLEGWLSTPQLPVPRQGWKPWPLASYQAMRTAGDAIEDPNLWLAHQLLRRLGLRTGELKAATSDWIVPMVGDGWGLDVRDYPAGICPYPYQIKGAAARILPLPHDLAVILRQKQGWLIEGQREFDVFRGKVRIRMPLIDDVHAQWLRAFCPAGVQKPNHELRKWVGAVLFTTQGAAAASRFLGHSDSKVLEAHYSDYLRKLEVDEQWKELAL